MRSQQKAMLVKTCPDSVHGLDELNLQLSRGWRVSQISPMGAAGVGAQDDSPALHFAALVIIERASNGEASILEESHEIEGLLEELVDENNPAIEVKEDFDADQSLNKG